MTFDVWPSHRDLRETYLPAFRAAVREAKVASVMAAYNRLYGDPCCASRLLLEEILRKEWGFEGFVVSDGGGFDFVHGNHMVSCGPAETVAMSFRNGCDMELGNVCEKGLGAALERGLLTAADLDRCLRHSLTILFRLGFFDADGGPYAATPYRVVGCREHRELALEMARQSLVLIKNENRLLPLSRDLANVAVIGPNADSRAVLIGNYNGIPARQITALQGIQDLAGEATRIWFAQGCDLTDKPVFFAFGPKERNLSEAVAAAKRSAVAILCLGLDPTMEGENGDPEADETDAGGDRRTLDLPKSQQELLRAIRATGTPVVLVLFGGSPVTGVYQHADAVIQAFYPGEAGGQALAEVLFGDVNPAGRLPVTIPQSTEQLPPFADYQMRGRTYRFMAETPAYCFGHGLSYTTFEYTDVALSRAHIQAGQTVELSVRVRNTGPRAGDEVVQVYLRDVEASVPVPRVKLCGATRISLAPGEQKSVSVHIPEQAFQAYDDKGAPRIETGVFELFVGGGCPRQEGVRGQWTSLTVT